MEKVKNIFDVATVSLKILSAEALGKMINALDRIVEKLET